MEFVYEIENLVPDKLCEEIIDKYNSTPDELKQKGIIGPNIIDERFKKNTEMFIENKENFKEWFEISEKLNTYLTEGLNKYEKHLRTFLGNKAELFMCNFDNFIKSDYKIKHYRKNEYYHWHSDSSDQVNEDRLMAFIFYLNTLEETCGGSTEFYDGTKIKPTRGKLLFFPVSHFLLHRGEIIKNKEKYIINGFIMKYKKM